MVKDVRRTRSASEEAFFGLGLSKDLVKDRLGELGSDQEEDGGDVPPRYVMAPTNFLVPEWAVDYCSKA